ncbi:MAG TPA: ABC transporter substrate-binding protein [Ktedonobacterales bacterium]|nr:ABC transporter substrate-binding protein [Ktedonobacterales bacterium]
MISAARHQSDRTHPWTLRTCAVFIAMFVLVLSACGSGNVSTPKSTPGAVHIGNAGTLIPGMIKWGEDSTGGMPYIVPKDANNPNAAYYGFEYDIANAMAKLMNVQQQPTQITWSNWPQGLSSQQFDFFMNGLEISPDTLKSAKFSIPYYVYTQSIVVLTTNTTINSFNDLAGKTVETGTGYQAETVMDNWNSQNPSNKINIKTTDNPTPFSDLLSNRVDAMFIDTPIAEWYGGNDPSGKFKVVGGALDPGYYAIGFNPASANTPTLMKEVNLAIEQMYRDGTLQKIYGSGGAYNVGPNNQPVLEKYGMWNDSQACIGNFLPDNPTNVPNCPAMPTAAP